MSKPVLLILTVAIGSLYVGLRQFDRVGQLSETITDYSMYAIVRVGFGNSVIGKGLKDYFRCEVISKFW